MERFTEITESGKRMVQDIAGVHWEAVGAGHLALRGRPGKKLIPLLKAAGCDRVVTLLSAKEEGEAIGQALQLVGILWMWLPLINADVPSGDANTALIEALPILSAALDRGEAILIHCSAGIHRTGMFAYALLRWRGMGQEGARDVLARLRDATAQGMHPHHFAWGDSIAPNKTGE